MTDAQSQTDKFETLCCVEADFSTAPYESKLTATGTTYYKRSFTIILLVGLTELKAQVGWIDSETVSAHVALQPHSHTSPNLHVRESRGQREGS